MNEALEEKLQRVTKAFGEVVENAGDKASSLFDADALDQFSSVGQGAAVGARRGGEDFANTVKSQLRSKMRGAKSGVDRLVDQGESLSDLAPSAADIRHLQRSGRRIKKTATRQGRALARSVDEKSGRHRHRVKVKKGKARAAILLVTIFGVGFAIVLFAKKNGARGTASAYPPVTDQGRDRDALDEAHLADGPGSVDPQPKSNGGSDSRSSRVKAARHH